MWCGGVGQPLCLVVISYKQRRGYNILHRDGHVVAEKSTGVAATSQGNPGFLGASETEEEARKYSSDDIFLFEGMRSRLLLLLQGLFLAQFSGNQMVIEIQLRPPTLEIIYFRPLGQISAFLLIS